VGKYRKKPVVIEAERYGGTIEQVTALQEKYGLKLIKATHAKGSGHYVIETLEGDMRVNLGDWIITGIKGERYPCKPDIFAATYEPVEPTHGK
jgi:hypothetical protein